MIFQCIKDNKEVPEDLYILVDRIFKFSYKYIWPDMKKQTVFVKLMFEMGYSLAERYPKDSESAKEFYYPAMMDICEQRLADKTLDLESRMFTNIIMAANVGMIGEVEKRQEYLDQALFTSLKMAQKDKGAFKAVLGRKKKRSATKKEKRSNLLSIIINLPNTAAEIIVFCNIYDNIMILRATDIVVIYYNIVCSSFYCLKFWGLFQDFSIFISILAILWR